MLNFFIYRSVSASVIPIIIRARLFHDCRSPAFSGFRLTRGIAAALSPAPEAEAPFANSLRPGKRAPTDQMRQSAWGTTIDINRRTKP
jgi:hypothetical protein